MRDSPWLADDHPDPRGEMLRQISFVFKAFADRAARFEGCRVGVFWDYTALPQRNPESGADDRIEEEKERADRAMRTAVPSWYSHPSTFVLLCCTPLPTAFAAVYTKDQPYRHRGWCVTERTMSAITKDSAALIDLRTLRKKPKDIRDILRYGKLSRPPPMAPDAFRSMLEAGLADGTIRFTYETDRDAVGDIYEGAFMGQLREAPALHYDRLDWGDDEAVTLAAALAYAGQHGGLRDLEILQISHNQIGDRGMIALGRAVTAGALPADCHVYLDGNPGNELHVLNALDGVQREA